MGKLHLAEVLKKMIRQSRHREIVKMKGLNDFAPNCPICTRPLTADKTKFHYGEQMHVGCVQKPQY